MRGRQFTQEEVETIRSMAAEGATQRAVADALGRAKQNIWRVARREGIAFGHEPLARAFRQDEIDAIRKWLAEGVTQSECADRLGRTHGAVNKLVHRLQIPYTKDETWKAKAGRTLAAKAAARRRALVEDVRRYADEGLPLWRIAEAAGINPKTAAKVIREFGIERESLSGANLCQGKVGAIVRMGRPRLQKNEPHLTADAAMHLARNGFRPVYRADIEALHTPAAFSRVPDAYVVGRHKMPTGEMLALARALGFAR